MNNTTLFRQSNAAGLPPGALVHIGKKKTDEVKISVIDYSKTHHKEEVVNSVTDCEPYKDSETLTWINIDGLHDTQAIGTIGNYFGLHPLVLEDILNTKHRPKLEEFDNYSFVTLKMIGVNESNTHIVTEQVSIVLGKSWLISFQEQEGDIFDVVRQRLRDNIGIIRTMGIDYLFYRLMDVVVDNYYFVIEHIGESLESLEERVMEHPTQNEREDIQQLKKMLIRFRRNVSPLREVVSSLMKENTNLIKKVTIRYLRDLYENIIFVNESIEIQRDMLAGILDLYLSGISNKMNQVMQVLTIMATIFIPLTFIAGIYGMNFEYIPELHMKNGYFYCLGLMFLIFVGLLFYFKKKKWL